MSILYIRVLLPEKETGTIHRKCMTLFTQANARSPVIVLEQKVPCDHSIFCN
uniref:Uncharacterized protein n=1 Tax=Octopus bimaculoides TaxID=37653 RepID=A0A0L8HX91_OCTBM